MVIKKGLTLSLVYDMMLSIRNWSHFMNRRQRYLIQVQTKVKVATPAYRPTLLDGALFFASAFAFTGAFYFLGELLWHVLTGG